MVQIQSGYHFPLDGNPADLDAGTKIFEGKTNIEGKVTCTVSPGCYMIAVTSPSFIENQRNSPGDGKLRSSIHQTLKLH